MKYRFVLAVIVVSILLCSSCVVLSLEPWFSTDVQVFEERLLGKWGDADDYWKFKRGPRNSYVATLSEQGEGDVRFRATLGSIEGAYYLDGVVQNGLLDPDDPEWMHLAHFLGRLEFGRDKIRLRVLNTDRMDRMEEMIEAGHLSGTATEDGELVIVSSTETLQSFLAEHGQDEDLWDEEDWLPRM